MDQKRFSNQEKFKIHLKLQKMVHEKSKVETGNKQDPKAGLSVPVEDGEIDNEHLNDNQAQKDQQSEDLPPNLYHCLLPPMKSGKETDPMKLVLHLFTQKKKMPHTTLFIG